MNPNLAKVTTQYAQLRRLAPIGVIRSRAEYARATRLLDAILDEIGEDENHAMADLAEAIAIFVEEYDRRHFPVPNVSGAEALRFLMEQNDLRQADLAAIGSQGVVSEILSGRRELNARQIGALAQRFNVPADVFYRTKSTRVR